MRVCVCVGLSVGHVREPCENDWTDRDAVWGGLTHAGLRKHVYYMSVRVGRIHSPPRGVTRRRCGLLSKFLNFCSLHLYIFIFIHHNGRNTNKQEEKVKYTSICIAHFYARASNTLRHRSHSFTCKLHHACLYFPAAEYHRPLAGTYFTIPRRVEGWVDLGGWLHTEIKCRLRESNPDTVTYPSTNRAQCRLTSLI